MLGESRAHVKGKEVYDVLKSWFSRQLARHRLQPRPRDVRQGEVAECGLAALASLMSVYGANVPMARLRELAASTLYGTSVRTLRQIAIRVGFEARAWRVEHVADLAARVPCVVHLNFIHFAVAERVTATEVLLSDPLAGPVRMPIDRFSRSFTGVALTLAPTPFLRRNAEAVPTSRRIIWSASPLVAAGVAASFGSGLAQAVAAIGAGMRIDARGDMVLPLAALAVALVLTEMAIRCATAGVAGFASRQQMAAINHVAGQPAATFVLRSPFQANALLAAPRGLIDPTLVDASLAASAGAAILAGAFVAAPMLALAGSAMVAMEAALAAALLLQRGGAVPHLRLWPMPVRAPTAEDIARVDGWSLGHGANALFQSLAGSQAAAAAGMMPGAERGAVLAGVRAGGAGLRLMVLVLAGVALWHGGASPGALFAAGTLVMLAGAQLGRGLAGLRTPAVTAALHRLVNRADTPPGPRPSVPPAGFALVFDQVAWRAAEILPDVVQELDLRLAVGKSLAIVAPPRSGATTVARLAAGWIAPTSGTVHAEPAILLGTRWLAGRGRVRDLLAMDSGSTDAAMLDMLDALGVSETLAGRGGLDLRLTEGAPELSGGQRRRLAIAAALLRKPRLLILDGTLEALDTEGASRVLAACRARRVAVLLAGHREDIAALCDDRYSLSAPRA